MKGQPLYKEPGDVPYIDDQATIAVVNAAIEALNSFPILAHDIAMVGLAMQNYCDEIIRDHPETVPDALQADVERQVYTHYIASLVSALQAAMQQIAIDAGQRQDKQIVDAGGKPLRLL